MTRKKSRSIYSGAISLLTAFGTIFRSPIVLAWLFAIGGIVVLSALSVPKLRATRIAAADVQVVFQDPPIWLDASLLLELQGVARIHLAQAPVGRKGLTQTVDALFSTGWFSDIEQVRWINSNQAVVDASFLIPYAKVLDSEGLIFIDVHGKCLPTRAGSIVKPNYHFITLHNSQFQRPQRPGLQWNGEDVHAGLTLLKYIYDKPWVSQITSINLARWVENKSLTMATKTPSTFVWGSAPKEERALEALVDEKIDRLNHLHANYGLIDRGISAKYDLTDTARIMWK